MTRPEDDGLRRLRLVRDPLLADGWPDWLDSTVVDADGPAIVLKAGTDEAVVAEVRRRAEPHGVRVQLGGGSSFGWSATPPEG